MDGRQRKYCYKNSRTFFELQIPLVNCFERGEVHLGKYRYPFEVEIPTYFHQ